MMCLQAETERGGRHLLPRPSPTRVATSNPSAIHRANCLDHALAQAPCSDSVHSLASIRGITFTVRHPAPNRLYLVYSLRNNKTTTCTRSKHEPRSQTLFVCHESPQPRSPNHLGVIRRQQAPTAQARLRIPLGLCDKVIYLPLHDRTMTGCARTTRQAKGAI